MSRNQGHWCYYERRARVHRMLSRLARFIGAPGLAARYREPDHGTILDHGDILSEPPGRPAPSRPDTFLVPRGRQAFTRGTGIRRPEDIEKEPGR
jgi:hypothetical protein